jgi:putative transcriptional regulator (Ypuh-like)
VATLGACLAAVRRASFAELAEASGTSIAEVRLGLRRVAEELEPARMQVLDDGVHVQLAPAKRFQEAVGQLVQPERLPRLTQEQAEVLAVVIMDGMATRRRIEEVRGAASLSIGPEGPVSLPRDSSETLALLLSRGCSRPSGTIMPPGVPSSTGSRLACCSCSAWIRSRRHGRGWSTIPLTRRQAKGRTAALTRRWLR